MNKITQEEEWSNDICGIDLYAQMDEDKWYIDNGCTKHMIGDKEKSITLKREKGWDVSFGDDGTTRYMGKGTMALKGRAKTQTSYMLKDWNMRC